MDQTPIHDMHNPDLLELIPAGSQQLVEIGCSSGALAREFKKINPGCNYLGIDIDPAYTERARLSCDEVLAMNIDDAGDDFFAAQRQRDAWIFGDTLEHLKDPWRVLRKIREVIPAHGCVIACIPNMQHWTIQVQLSVGDLRYQDSGLLDRTHLRWFTRQTMLQMFADTGFALRAGKPRIFNEPARDRFLPLIGELAKAVGADPALAINDALPMQFVLRVAPV